MSDALLSGPDREEALSRVYACAVAAVAGYTTEDCKLDRDGVDLSIQAGGDMRPGLDLQLKATVNMGEPRDGHFRFPLKLRNYDLLRIETQTPRLLLVLDLPRDEGQWLTITVDGLMLRRRAYWANLKGCGETDNQTSVTVSIPEANVFDVESLRVLMDQSRGGIIR